MKDNQLLLLGVAAFVWWNMQDKPATGPPNPQGSTVRPPPNTSTSGSTSSAADDFKSRLAIEQEKTKRHETSALTGMLNNIVNVAGKTAQSFA